MPDQQESGLERWLEKRAGNIGLRPRDAAYLIGGVCLSIYFAPTFAVAQNLVDARMRASASALMFLLINICGQGIGPSVMGLVSDLSAQNLFKGQSNGFFTTITALAKAADGVG